VPWRLGGEGFVVKITRIETIPVLVPIKPELAIRFSGGVHDASPFLLVKVHTDAGIVGIGEASCTPVWSGEDHWTAKHFIDTILEPALVGVDARSIEQITATMDRALAGNVFTKSAIQMACWDIWGKDIGQPLYQLLGGKQRESVELKFSISGAEPARAAEIACWAVEQGFRTVKVKVGGNTKDDLERVRAVRKAVGTAVRIGVDANGGWPAPEAIRAIRLLEDDCGIAFAEQPVSPLDPSSMAQVRREVSVPIVADESVFDVGQAQMCARSAGADVFSLYVGKGGGIAGAREMAAVAQSAGLTCTVGSNLEFGVASAAMIHLALATQAVEPERMPCDIIGPLYYGTDLLMEPLPIRAGCAYPLERPGLGVELDEAQVARYRV
jgi:L-alanine-DL-glutamate epimerase-like enolase superfamily enzyme